MSTSEPGPLTVIIETSRNEFETFARRIVKCPFLAEDAIAEASLKLVCCERRDDSPTFQSASQKHAFVKVVVYRECLNIYRERNRKHEPATNVPDWKRESPDRNTPETNHREETIERQQQAIKQLSPEIKEIFELQVYGKTYQEIIELLDLRVTDRTIRNWLSSARTQARNEFERLNPDFECFIEAELMDDFRAKPLRCRSIWMARTIKSDQTDH